MALGWPWKEGFTTPVPHIVIKATVICLFSSGAGWWSVAGVPVVFCSQKLMVNL